MSGTCPLWGDCNAPEHDKRIAELEADLAERTLWAKAMERDAKKHGVPVDEMQELIRSAKESKARAEKAEAEVERLKADCRAHTRNHRVPGHTHPEPCCLADYPGFHCREA